jgi:Tol biopolymer transport system component
MSLFKIFKILIVAVLSCCLLFTLGTTCRSFKEEADAAEAEMIAERLIEAAEKKSSEETTTETPEEKTEEEPDVPAGEETKEMTIYDMIFYSNLGDPSNKGFSGYSIFGCNLDGSGLCQIYDSGTGDLDPKYNSDYSKIVFSSFMDEDDDSDIFIYDFKTGEVIKVLDREGNDFSPDFSPDDKAIVFQGFAADKGCYMTSEIFVVNIDGSGLMQLTDNKYYDGLPDFSPDQDQSQLMFTSDRDGANKIYTMKSDGTGIMQRTNFGDWNDFDGCFSTEGDYAILVSDRTGDYDIWAVPLVDDPDLQLEVSMVLAYNISDNPANDMLHSCGPDKNVVTYLTDRQYDNFIYNMTWTELTGDNTWTEPEPIEEYKETIIEFDQDHPYCMSVSLDFKF